MMSKHTLSSGLRSISGCVWVGMRDHCSELNMRKHMPGLRRRVRGDEHRGGGGAEGSSPRREVVRQGAGGRGQGRGKGVRRGPRRHKCSTGALTGGGPPHLPPRVHAACG